MGEFSKDQKSIFGGSNSNKHQIRATRFDELSSVYSLKMKYNDSYYKIENISDSGIRVECQNETFNANEVIELKIFTNQNALVHEGNGRVAWVDQINGQFFAGIEFRDKMLPKGFLKSLDKLFALEISVADSTKQFNELPEHFRTLVYEIKNFLMHLKKNVDHLEDELLIESAETKTSILSALDVRFGQFVQEKLIFYSNRLFEFLKEIKTKREKTQYYALFRKELNEFYLQSPYARRALEKPHGYAGDFEMMNQVYRDQYEGTTLFAKLIHRYTVNEFAAKSVRERRQYLCDQLRTYLLSCSGKKTNINICSLASGPALEIVDLLKNFPEISVGELNITLVDQDVESLLDARRNISNAMNRIPIPIKLKCLPIGVKSILEGASEASDFLGNQYDFIYTAGLYDYLMDPVAIMLSQIVYERLKNNGTLLIGNFHPDTPTRAICEFSVDWQLLYRDEDDMKKITEATKPREYKISTDSQGYVVYTNMKK